MKLGLLFGYDSRTKIIDGMEQYRNIANEEARQWQRLRMLEAQCQKTRAKIDSIRQDMARIVDSVEDMLS